MKQFDLEKVETALTFVERIADGKNPINNDIADKDDVMNDPVIIRSMFFVKVRIFCLSGRFRSFSHPYAIAAPSRFLESLLTPPSR